MIYKIKSKEYCDFYCGPQPLTKEKPSLVSNFDFLDLISSVAYGTDLSNVPVNKYSVH